MEGSGLIMVEVVESPFIDDIIKAELVKIKKRVLTKDRDFVAVYDGEEGVGKSVLAMQHAKFLDPNFNLDKVVFNADQFIKKVRDPETVKGACIVLDEAFNAINARGSLTEINRSMVALATEMRQKNLFILIVLPSFFDLDRYFALWRCRALFHLYFTPEEDRRYITFDKDSKKLLYLAGKKTYNYQYPKAPFPPCNFYNQYVVDETAYRLKKADAFKGRKSSQRAITWLKQRNVFAKWLYKNNNLSYVDLGNILKEAGVDGLEPSVLSDIMEENIEKMPILLAK